MATSIQARLDIHELHIRQLQHDVQDIKSSLTTLETEQKKEAEFQTYLMSCITQQQQGHPNEQQSNFEMVATFDLEINLNTHSKTEEASVCLPEKKPNTPGPHDMQLDMLADGPLLSGTHQKVDRKGTLKITSGENRFEGNHRLLGEDPILGLSTNQERKSISTDVSSQPSDRGSGIRVRSVLPNRPGRRRRWKKIKETPMKKNRESVKQAMLNNILQSPLLSHKTSPSSMAQVRFHLGRYTKSGFYHPHRRKSIANFQKSGREVRDRPISFTTSTLESTSQLRAQGENRNHFARNSDGISNSELHFIEQVTDYSHKCLASWTFLKYMFNFMFFKNRRLEGPTTTEESGGFETNTAHNHSAMLPFVFCGKIFQWLICWKGRPKEESRWTAGTSIPCQIPKSSLEDKTDFEGVGNDTY